MITIKEFEPAQQAAAIVHILDIENNEFAMGLTLEQQTDIVDIQKEYQQRNGNFWIALDEENVIGTTGIYSLPGNIGELRRMFVKPQYRSKEFKVAQQLLDISLNWARANSYKKIFLETTDWLVAATKFYLKNKFTIIDKTELPKNLPILRSTGTFMVLDL
jgi:N-acetylglutamate synthase-like GNAT family acetyltransferase